jgi:hypothetical protein
MGVYEWISMQMNKNHLGYVLLDIYQKINKMLKYLSEIS